MLVLWLLALLSMLVTSAIMAGRSESGAAAALLARAQAEAQADAGINLAIIELLRSREDRRWRTDGRTYAESFGGRPLMVSLVAETGKVDLNHARPELLRGLFAEFMRDEEAARLADAVLDWRDPDTTSQPRGAEDPDYRKAGRQQGARDSAFLSTGELSRVLGADAALVQSLREFVTVHSVAGGVDPRNAPAAVLKAVPGLEEDQVERYLMAREAPGFEEIAAHDLLRGGESWLQQSDGNIYTVRATATQATAIVTREAVVRITGSRKRPWVILSWGSVPVAREAALAGAGET